MTITMLVALHCASVVACTADETTANAKPLSLRMVEAGRDAGLGDLRASRVAVADLDGDGRPDLIVDRSQVWMNRAQSVGGADPVSSAGDSGERTLPFRFERIDSGLDDPGDGGVRIFVDLDGDRLPDAVVARTAGTTTWQRGTGDGRFAPGIAIASARTGTVGTIAAGDLDRDGRTDLLIARWYRAYGTSLEADPVDLLLNRAASDGTPLFERAPLPEDGAAFDETSDAAGRPLYGAFIAELLDPSLAAPPQLLQLAYGRRWNRLYVRHGEAWIDRAPALGLDGDADRSGVYPEWLRERARSDPRFDRQTEKPFRANGNTFDAAVGDLDGDGRFDLVLAEITHAWAGPSSDRSRVLLQRNDRFETSASYSLDRIPDEGSPEARRWNQGDLFVEMADLDLDGHLDVVLASGDYPDPPPFDERLRIFMQDATRGSAERSGAAPNSDPAGSDVAPSAVPRLVDMTAPVGVDLPGCGQIALADFDGDGRIDLVAGQSFTRFTPAMIEAAGGAPRVRLFLNRAAGDAAPRRAIVLELEGDPALGVAPQPFGAIVEVRSRDPDGSVRTQRRQLMAPGGHAGKQSQAAIFVGVGDEPLADVRVIWPAARPLVSEWRSLAPGVHRWRVAPPLRGTAP